MRLIDCVCETVDRTIKTRLNWNSRLIRLSSLFFFSFACDKYADVHCTHSSYLIHSGRACRIMFPLFMMPAEQRSDRCACVRLFSRYQWWTFRLFLTLIQINSRVGQKLFVVCMEVSWNWKCEWKSRLQIIYDITKGTMCWTDEAMDKNG